MIDQWQYMEMMERDRQRAMMHEQMHRQQEEMMRYVTMQPMRMGADWATPTPKKDPRNNEILLLTEI